MASLTESTIKNIVRDELRDIKHEMERLRAAVALNEQRMSEIHNIQMGVARLSPEIQQLLSIARALPDERRALGRIQSGLDEVRNRLNTIERSVAYASSYAALRLKERAERDQT